MRYACDFTLVPYTLLRRHEIQLWGAFTLAEYQTTIEQDVASAWCFEAVRLPSSRMS